MKQSLQWVGLKNLFALVVIVLLIIVLLSVSLWKDNKVPFKEIQIVENISESIPVKQVTGSTLPSKKNRAKHRKIDGMEVMPFKETTTTPTTLSVQKTFVEKFSFLAIAEMCGLWWSNLDGQLNKRIN